MHTRQSRPLSYALGELLWSLLQLSLWILALGKHKSAQQHDIKEFRHNQSLDIKCLVSSWTAKSPEWGPVSFTLCYSIM